MTYFKDFEIPISHPVFGTGEDSTSDSVYRMSISSTYGSLLLVDKDVKIIKYGFNVD